MSGLSAYIDHFPGKQGLGISLFWPALKCKQSVHVELSLVDLITHLYSSSWFSYLVGICGVGIKVHNKYNTTFFMYLSNCMAIVYLSDSFPSPYG